MNDDEKIAFDLYSRYGVYDENKNPDGLTEDDIKEYISKLNKIAKKELVSEIEKNIEQYNKSLIDEYQEKNKHVYEENYNKVLEYNKQAIEELKTQIGNIDNIFGIPVNREDHENYLKEFESAITPDKATGRRGIDDILSNDVTLYKAFLLLAKFGEDKVIEVITKGRESAKEEIFKKLGITPDFVSGRSRQVGTELDAATAARLLSIPEQY